MSTSEAAYEYEQALRLAKKDGGELEVLDSILEEKNITTPTEVTVGYVQIPADQIAGTKTDARSNAFSKNFYPALGAGTEFAHKWIALCKAHLEEGIREPVKVYEFMHKFYVAEGNKRVSVLKYFGAPVISAYVIRILPPYSEEKDVRIYYEFLDFYRLSSIYYLTFSKEGSYKKLQKLVGKHPDEIWSMQDRRRFLTLYTRFCDEFTKILPEETIRPEDAFLYFIDLYPYSELIGDSYRSFILKIEKLKEEFKLLEKEDSMKLHMEPEDSKKESLIKRLIPKGSPNLKVAFIHEKTAETSGRTFSHELGRAYLSRTFPEQVATSCYDNVTEATIDETLTLAIEEKNDLIFTTSPVFAKASLKAALLHPDIKIMNCSLHTSHKAIRTYYLRMYEVKFLLGIIAGVMTENHKIGYLVKYPTHGTASINAFSLGAKMINPNARIYLLDERIANEDENFFFKNDISIICGRDMVPMGVFDNRFGLYRVEGTQIWNMAMPVWNWDIFYEKMIRNIIDGKWNLDDTTENTQGLNYWWGLSTGVVDFICSHRLPQETMKLIEFLKSAIISGTFSPFSGILYDQSGEIRNHSEEKLSPKEIVQMDWLCDNVIGTVSKEEHWD